MSDEPADEPPVDDDEPNRFVWGPGELEMLDPVTGKFVRIGRPPERVRKMLEEQKSGEDNIDTSDIPEADENWFKRSKLVLSGKTKKKLHIHLHQK